MFNRWLSTYAATEPIMSVFGYIAIFLFAVIAISSFVYVGYWTGLFLVDFVYYKKTKKHFKKCQEVIDYVCSDEFADQWDP